MRQTVLSFTTFSNLMPLPAKQVIKIVSAPIRVSNFSASSTSSTITTAISTAVSTAGAGGVSVPLQVSSSDSTIGVIASGTSNRIEIADSDTKDKITDGDGNEVYGRLTHATGVYTLTYYSLVDGTETSYSFSSATNIDFEFNYRFDFARLPTDFAIAIGTRNIAQDPRSSGGTPFAEALTVTAQNTLANLTKTPISASTLELLLNGESFNSLSGAFSVSGKTITWNAVTAGVTIETTDGVFVRYNTNE